MIAAWRLKLHRGASGRSCLRLMVLRLVTASSEQAIVLVLPQSSRR